MKRLNCKITVGNKLFRWATEINIQSSWKQFTDNVRITIPKNIRSGDVPIVNGANSLFKRGDKVSIELGYFPNLTKVFDGYISDVKINTPIELTVSDAMFLLKNKSFSNSWKKVSLNQLLTYITAGTGIEFNCPDADLGSFRVVNVTAVQILDELKQTYFLDSFIQNGVLYVGRQYIAENEKIHAITIEKQVIDNSLIWRDETDIKIKLKAVSMLPDNTKIEIEVGDGDGETRTAHYYNLDKKSLTDIATAEINKYKFTGFRGGFETFGEPVIQHGDLIELKSLKIPERSGRYFVDSVETVFGMNGFRQKIELGRKG
jgi:hypothetical protein